MDETIGRAIQSLREQQGLSQEELASRAEVSRSTIQSAEMGRRTPRPASLRRIARALSVDIGVLTSGEPYTPEQQAFYVGGFELGENLNDETLTAILRSIGNQML